MCVGLVTCADTGPPQASPLTIHLRDYLFGGFESESSVCGKALLTAAQRREQLLLARLLVLAYVRLS